MGLVAVPAGRRRCLLVCREPVDSVQPLMARALAFNNGVTVDRKHCGTACNDSIHTYSAGRKWRCEQAHDWPLLNSAPQHLRWTCRPLLFEARAHSLSHTNKNFEAEDPHAAVWPFREAHVEFLNLVIRATCLYHRGRVVLSANHLCCHLRFCCIMSVPWRID